MTGARGTEPYDSSLTTVLARSAKLRKRPNEETLEDARAKEMKFVRAGGSGPNFLRRQRVQPRTQRKYRQVTESTYIREGVRPGDDASSADIASAKAPPRAYLAGESASTGRYLVRESTFASFGGLLQFDAIARPSEIPRISFIWIFRVTDGIKKNQLALDFFPSS